MTNAGKSIYDDVRPIIQKHVKALFKLSPIAKENYKIMSASEWRSKAFLKHLRALKTIGCPIDSWDILLLT